MNGSLVTRANLLVMINDRTDALAAHYQDQHPSCRIKVLDVWGLSWPRREEMPFDGDGLHWACISKGKKVS